MRRITFWLTATVALVALLVTWQLTMTGGSAKSCNAGTACEDHGGKPGERK